MQRRVGLQAIEGETGAAQLGFKVEPGGEGTLAGPLWVVVQDRVQNLQAVMAHAQCIGVGEGQAELAADLAVVLDDAIQLAAHVLGRHLDARQDTGDGFLQGRIEHGLLRFGERGASAPCYVALIREASRNRGLTPPARLVGSRWSRFRVVRSIPPIMGGCLLRTPHMPTTSASLLERLRRPGQQDAWERFVELYTPLPLRLGTPRRLAGPGRR